MLRNGGHVRPSQVDAHPLALRNHLGLAIVDRTPDIGCTLHGESRTVGQRLGGLAVFKTLGTVDLLSSC